MNQRDTALLDLERLQTARPLLDALPFPVLWIDAEYSVRYRNAAAERAYGTAAGSCHEISHGYSRPCDRHGEACPMAQATSTQAPVTVCHAHVTGGHAVALHKVIAIPLQGGGILECQVDLDDVVTEDELTGVCGRGFFVRIVERELTLLKRLEQPYAFLMIDLDGFKAVNDTHGHDVGDEVLRRSATALRQGLRKSDVAGRWGGDEFVLFLPSMEPSDAVALAERRAAAIRRLAIPAATGEVRPEVSIGLFCSDRVYDLAPAFRAADRALYRAKRAGGNRIVLAD